MRKSIRTPPVNAGPLPSPSDGNASPMAKRRSKAPSKPTTTDGLECLSNTAHWLDVISRGALGSIDPGALLMLYDRRDNETDPTLATYVIKHVIASARALLGRTVRFTARNRLDVIEDAVGEIGIAIQEGNPGAREFFTRFVQLRGIDAERDQYRHGASGDGDQKDAAGHPDPESAAVDAIDLRRVVEGIADPAHRLALMMDAAGATYEEIAEAVGRTPPTVSGWIKAMRKKLTGK